MPENLYKRKGVWYTRVKVAGRDHRRSLRTSSKALAKKKRKQILDALDHQRFTGEERHSWKSAVVEWTKSIATSVKPSVLTRYKYSLKGIRDVMDPLYIDEVTTKTVAQVIKHRREANATNATIRRDLTAMSSVLRYCVAQGWRDDNPAKAYDRGIISEKRDPIVLPLPADVEAVAGMCKGNFAQLVRFARQCGMRQEEMVSLEHPQLRRKGRAADLTKTKTNRARSVPLSDSAWGTYEGTERHPDSEVVFWHSEGKRYRNVASRFRATIQRAIRDGKISREFRFHDLRHLFAVEYLRAGGVIYTLQQILGHSSLKTTEIYLDFLTPEESNRAKYGAQKRHKGAGLSADGEPENG